MNPTWLWLKMKLGLEPDILLAECPRCGAKSLHSAAVCAACGAAFPEVRKVVKFGAPGLTPDDFIEGMVEAFVKCPNCGRQLKHGARTCPECKTVITDEYAAESISAQVRVAQAYSLAGRVESFNPVAFIVVAVSAWAAWFSTSVLFLDLLLVAMLFVVTLVCLYQVRLWFRWFGSDRYDDEDFASARRKAKGARRLWLAALAAQVILLAVRAFL